MVGDTTVPLAELVDISKRFGNTQALKSASLRVEGAQILAIVGENGAGKSTMGKILAGLYQPDSGEIRVDGEPVSRWGVHRAQQHGIVMIAQELSLVPELTVAQNIFLGRENAIAGFLRKDLRERFDELEKDVGFGLNPDARVSSLRIAEQQKVEIMRALARDARVLVLDEPTSSLTGHETEQLHATMRRLVERGTAIIYVSHFLDAVLEVSNTVVVMRNGEHVTTAPAAELTKAKIVAHMLGRELASAFPERRMPDLGNAEPLMEARELRGPGVDNVSITVYPGEIVGLLGLVGSGRTEVGRLLFGAERVESGTVRFNGKELPRDRRVSHAIRLGMVMVPEDRHKQGLFLERSIRENISIPWLSRFTRLGFISARREKLAVGAMAEALSVRPSDTELEVKGLSGGNQQKVLIGKWLLNDPRLVILDEPTRGVDIGAKLSIYNSIQELAASGAGVLLISSEHEEILNLAHRSYLVSDGRTVGEITPEDYDMHQVLERLFEAQETRLECD